LFHLFISPAAQLVQRRAKSDQAEILLAAGTFDAVKEGGDFNQLVTGIEKVEVEGLLLGHTSLKEYNEEWFRDNC
jgi:hypothetical protein